MKTCRICRECAAIEDMKDQTNGVCRDCKGATVVEMGGGNDDHQEAELRLLDGYLNFDRVDYGGKTVVTDLEKYKPQDLECDHYDHIFSSHCLEHVRDIRNVMNNCHAMLKPGRFMEIVVPHADSDKAWAIDHVRVFTRETFRSLEYRDIADYGYRPWKVVYLEGEKDDAGNPELRCVLTPVK